MLESYAYRLRIDNRLNDYFIEKTHRLKKGTRVTFVLGERSQRPLKDVFMTYATKPAEPGFDRSEVKVRLFAMGTSNVSRSQARRLLVGLDRFRSVILDFTNVPAIGQAFADEVFRVFHRQHPNVEITPINMNETVRFMAERARTT